MSSSQFIDYIKIYCKSGNGGDGSLHFRREKYVPKGGPDGGDGGDGGDIILEGDKNLWTLLPFKYKRHLRAQNGKRGGESRSHGAKGEDLILKVPLGTIAKNEKGEFLLEIKEHAQRKILLKGEKGGKGNWHYKSAHRQTPRYAQLGKESQEASIILELKILADTALIGFPNAGKSTLLSTLSMARPKIANYPFTTLTPHIGVVLYKESASFILADIPGIIEGASQNKGLGHKFLRHIEKCLFLLFTISSESKDPINQYHILFKELNYYQTSLTKKPHIIIISKSDLINQEEKNELQKKFSLLNKEIIFISSFNKENMTYLKEVLYKKLYLLKCKT